LQLQAQNLQFNSAVFNEYGPFPGDGDAVTPFHTVQIVVGANQVLKLNVVRATGINVYLPTTPRFFRHLLTLFMYQSMIIILLLVVQKSCSYQQVHIRLNFLS
jgi:hypothetical protein